MASAKFAGVTMRIKETIARGILRALRSQFDTPYEALREIIDNALDHRGEERVSIRVTLGEHDLQVENVGGRGMGLHEIADFVAWGASLPRSPGDIGLYGQGGKAASLYLGRGF